MTLIQSPLMSKILEQLQQKLNAKHQFSGDKTRAISYTNYGVI